nr:hypothetical protein L204_03283 [Cryptococcus depauperatus CBS 7855]
MFSITRNNNTHQDHPAPNRPRAPAMILKKDTNEALFPDPLAKSQEKKKSLQYDFRYDDTDTLMNELEEFYPYVEMAYVGKGPAAFSGSFSNKWTEAHIGTRRAHIEVLLEQFESPSSNVRRIAQSQLLYIIHGCFAEISSPEEQLHWIIENAKTVRSVDGVAVIVHGLRDTARRYTASAEDKSSSGALPSGTVPAQVDPYDDHSAEFMDLIAMLYFIVEVLRTDDTFGDELMAMSPPLPLVLFQMISTLRDKIPRGYPVKKVLLLLWKTLLATLGGMKEAREAMMLGRELAGLDPNPTYFTKASPIDISSWRRDTATKYPTFSPPPAAGISTTTSTVLVDSSVPNEKLAEGIKPIPPRPDYHSTDLPPSVPRPYPPQNAIYAGANSQGGMSAPMPGTPAPSPPPSPAPGPNGPKKKQQYQTDPTRPFIFPYSYNSSSAAPDSLVPFAISEANTLYEKHVYVSLGLVQMWEAREEYIREERGLGKSGLIGFTNRYDKLGQEDDEDKEEVDAMMRDWNYEQEYMECEEKGDKEGAKKAKKKRMAAKRLRRVDIIHRNTLPILHSCIIALLKLLLATVTSPGTAGNPAGGTTTGGAGGGVNLSNSSLPPGLQSPTQEMPEKTAPPPTEEDIDIARHREITSKAISAIFLLVLKWFKASHILKFHLITQLLFDSNCLLLLLKMFGLTDLSTVVTARNEVKELNFFNYCANISSVSPAHPHNPILKASLCQAPEAMLPRSSGLPSQGTEYITDYSWRNFFSTINFLKVMQKVTKHRSHRTFVLSTYKSWQILKRMLKVNHPMMQLQVLKLIKSQMPWCGRKWRQATGNMKVITSIYLNCRPELRDDWLAGADQETEMEDAIPQDNALRTLVQFYNLRHYVPPTSQSPSPESLAHHRRSSSSNPNPLFEDSVLHTHQAHFGHPRSGLNSSTSGEDVFPPRKSHSMAISGMFDAVGIGGAEGSYHPDEMIKYWLQEYEDVLRDVFGKESGYEVLDEFGLSGNFAGLMIMGPSDPHVAASGVEDQDSSISDLEDRAWDTLSSIMNKGDEEEISDSESVVTVGELGDEARLGGGPGFGERRSLDEDVLNGNGEDYGGIKKVKEEKSRVGMGKGRRKSGAGENTWEHISPTLALLPRSPIERRRSSSNDSPLRPVMPGPLSHDAVFDEEDEMDTRGPMPIKMDTKDHIEREGGAVDEVEYTYGE